MRPRSCPCAVDCGGPSHRDRQRVTTPRVDPDTEAVHPGQHRGGPAGHSPPHHTHPGPPLPSRTGDGGRTTPGSSESGTQAAVQSQIRQPGVTDKGPEHAPQHPQAPYTHPQPGARVPPAIQGTGTQRDAAPSQLAARPQPLSYTACNDHPVQQCGRPDGDGAPPAAIPGPLTPGT